MLEIANVGGFIITNKQGGQKMKDNERMSKKHLKELANNMGATKIAENVYNYENKVYDLIKAYCNVKEYCCNKLVVIVLVFMVITDE